MFYLIKFQVQSAEENDLLLGFLDQQDFKSSKVWIGINDGKVEGTYVYDNTVEAITYQNFAKDSAPNSEERGMGLIYITFAKRLFFFVIFINFFENIF